MKWGMSMSMGMIMGMVNPIRAGTSHSHQDRQHNNLKKQNKCYYSFRKVKTSGLVEQMLIIYDLFQSSMTLYFQTVK